MKRILHTPGVVAGNPSNLAWGERQLGLRSKVIYFSKSKYDATHPEDIFLNGRNNFFLTGCLKFATFLYAIFFVDVVHFNNGQTLFPQTKPVLKSQSKLRRLLSHLYNITFGLLENVDAAILKLVGKEVYITFQGSDARLYSYHLKHYPITHCRVSETKDINVEVVKDVLKQKRISSLAKKVHRMFAVNPDLLQTLPEGSSFLPYCNVNIHDWVVNRIRPKLNKVVHAPSKFDVKGTKYVKQAVEELQIEGVLFEFELLHGIDQSEMKMRLDSADLVIDQLLVGWYGGLAVESMALGVPVICYLREVDLTLLSGDLRNDLPIINASPETIKDVLRETLQIAPSDYQKLQKKCRRYVETWHDPIKVAKVVNAQSISRTTEEKRFISKG